MFSLGGFDEETYAYMFGVNKFKQVKDNIRQLTSRLAEEKLTVLVNLEFRVPYKYELNIKEIRRVLNPKKYPFLGIRVLKEFLNIDGLEQHNNILYRDNNDNKSKACAYLRKTRFAANGEIWADGCVVSELPNDATLRLGTINDSWIKLEKKRKKIIDAWDNSKIIPKVCQNCTMYRSDNKSLKKDSTIPLWRELY